MLWARFGQTVGYGRVVRSPHWCECPAFLFVILESVNMTYEKIMAKILELELELNSTNIRPKKEQLERQISDLKSRAARLEKNRPAMSFGKKLSSDKIKPFGKGIEVGPPPFSNATIPSLTKKKKMPTLDKEKIAKEIKNNRTKPDALDKDPTDEEMNVLEKLVSKIVGRRIKFEDIPDDDPDFDQGLKSEGHIAYPAGRPDLRMGGMTARSGATTKFKKPLGMKGGGGLSKAQKQRIARLTQEYKQKKARKSNGKRTNR